MHLLLCSALAAAAPGRDEPPRAIVAPSQGAALDRVLLKSGGVVEGRIVAETPQSVAVEVGSGARIEIDARDVVSIARAPRTADDAPASRPAPFGEGASWWGLVRDAEGSLVGTRRLTLGVDPRDPTCLRLEETFTLADESGTVRVTRIEVADGEWRPKETLYREVYEGASSSVHAVVAGDRLEVDVLDPSGRTRETLPFSAEATFPLLFAERARRHPPGPGANREATVYDPFVRSFARRVARGEADRRLALGAEPPKMHRVLVLAARGSESATWIDASGEPARVELNGPDLVATRCTQEEAESARADTEGLAVACDLEGRVRLPAPSGEWRPDAPSAGALRLARRDGTASIVGCAIDVEPDATPEAAALVLERRMRASLESFEREPFGATRVGGLPTARFDFRHRGAGRAEDGIALAIRGPRGAWALVATFPPGDRVRAERELDRVLARAELRLD